MMIALMIGVVFFVLSLSVLLTLITMDEVLWGTTMRKKSNYLYSVKMIFDRILSSKVRISFVLLLVVIFSLSIYYKLLSAGVINNEFGENVFVELVGALFDVVVLVLFASILERFGNKQLEIKRLKRELRSLETWDEKEAAIKVAAIVEQLKDLGVPPQEIDLHNLHLIKVKDIQLVKDTIINSTYGISYEKTNLNEIVLSGISKMPIKNFRYADIQDGLFDEVNFEEVNFEGANLRSAIVLKSNFKGAIFTNANLSGAVFYGVDLSEAVLIDVDFNEKTKLINVNLDNAKVKIDTWIEYLIDLKIEGAEEIGNNYFVHPVEMFEDGIGEFFIIKDKNKSSTALENSFLKLNEFKEENENKLKKVLFVMSNPINTSRLRLDSEIRYIMKSYDLSESEELFDIKFLTAVRLSDLIEALHSLSPVALHFSGHGVAEGIILHDEDDHDHHLVKIDELKKLIGRFKSSIKLVFFNMCFSLSLAKTISELGIYSIGSDEMLHDELAVNFSNQFYYYVFMGDEFDNAFWKAKEFILKEEHYSNSLPELFFNGQKITN